MMGTFNAVQLATLHTFSNDGGGEWWWLGRLLMFLVWIVIVTLVIRWVVRGRHRQESPMDRARGILAERYARGEIDAGEYRQRSDQLRKS